MEPYGFWLWDACGDQLVHELGQQDIDFRAEFHLFVDKTGKCGWSRDERLETLDGRYETYAIEIRPGDTRRAMLTREVGGNDYLYLGLTREHDPKETVYQLACQAHGLSNPRRGP